MLRVDHSNDLGEEAEEQLHLQLVKLRCMLKKRKNVLEFVTSRCESSFTEQAMCCNTSELEDWPCEPNNRSLQLYRDLLEEVNRHTVSMGPYPYYL
jgi:hypothetical protein